MCNVSDANGFIYGFKLDKQSWVEKNYWKFWSKIQRLSLFNNCKYWINLG